MSFFFLFIIETVCNATIMTCHVTHLMGALLTMYSDCVYMRVAINYTRLNLMQECVLVLSNHMLYMCIVVAIIFAVCNRQISENNQHLQLNELTTILTNQCITYIHNNYC